MEVRNNNTALMNRAVAVDGYGSDGKERQHAKKVSNVVETEELELEDQPVMLSISAAGMKRSQLLEKQPAEEDNGGTFASGIELENMIKKMEGLSSQVINGNFSSSDRLNFNTELARLSYELNKMNGDNVVITKYDCTRLSQRISDLTRVINEAAVYCNSAKTVFMVNSRQPKEMAHTKLNIAI